MDEYINRNATITFVKKYSPQINGMTTLECVERAIKEVPAADVIITPCRVGDTVYSFCDDFGVILPYFVENLRIGFMDKDRNYLCYEANCHTEETDELLDEIDFDLDDIGKTVFLSKEEAERALKGGSNNG